MQEIGKLLITVGLTISLMGLIIFLISRNNIETFRWLPGDIVIRRENFTFIFPITTMILLSALFSFITWVISKIFK